MVYCLPEARLAGDFPPRRSSLCVRKCLVPASQLTGHSRSEQDQRLVRIATRTGKLLRTIHLSGGRADQGNGKLRHDTAYH